MPYELLEHPSDAYIHAYGQTWEEALRSSLEGMYSQVFEGFARFPSYAGDDAGEGVVRLTLEDEESEGLLQALLAEALYILETDGDLLYPLAWALERPTPGSDGSAASRGAWRLSGTLARIRPAFERFGEVKAVTRHLLRVEEGADGRVDLWFLLDL